jgi:hypothetical protein
MDNPIAPATVDSAGSAGAAAPARATGSANQRQRWQLQAGAAAPDLGDRRRRQLLLLAGLLLALVSAAAVWLLMMRPHPAPPFLLIIDLGELNARQYPVLAFASQDGQRLERHFPDKKRAETKTRELLLNELNGLAGRTDPLVVSITALALVREESVLLVPGDADPDDDATLLDVRLVIDALGRSAAPQKLLILDLAHPLADPRLGVLTDRVAQTLEDYFQVEPPPFPVICSASAGQVALHSEVVQCSVLSHYLDQGLAGSADTGNDLRVTVDELFNFVRPRVERWAQLNRGQRQRPRLFGNPGDFVLVGLGKNRLARVEQPKSPAYPQALKDGWARRDQWRDQGAIHRAPRLVMKLEANLLRQEALWRGGVIAHEDWDAFNREIAKLDRELAQSGAAQPTPVHSAAMASGAKANPVLTEVVLTALAAARDSAAKKDARAAQIAALVKVLQEPKDSSAAQQIEPVLEALDRVAELRPEQLEFAHDVLVQLQAKPRFAEMVCVRRLSEFAERVQVRDPESWPAEKALGLLQATRRREQVLAALAQEPGLLPWVAPVMEQADFLRHRGEQQLLWERPSQWADALAALQTAREQYRQAGETVQNALRARVAFERALADLPAYLTLICDWPEFQVQAESTWRDAAREARQLQQILGVQERAAGAVSALDSHRRSLERHLGALDTQLALHIALAKQGDNGVALAQALCLLRCPCLRAPDRLALFAQQQALADKLQAQTDKLDDEDASLARMTTAPMGPAVDTERGVARLRLSLAVLRLGGISGDGLADDVAGRLKPRTWTRLETGLHDLWSKALVERWQTATTPASADTLDRLVPPWELDRRAADAREPTRLRDQHDRAGFLRWLAERYQCDTHALEASGRDALAAAFFRTAAAELRLAAQDGSQ